VRFAIIRCWAAVATAILAAVGSDVSTEFTENCGWLGGVIRDNQHEAVLPALFLGAIVTLSLILFVLLSRIYPDDPLLSSIDHLPTRLVDAACSFGGSVLCVIAMEGYETRFGGLSPFDPGSVVLSHTLSLVTAFVIIGAIAHYALRTAIRAAAHASSIVTEVFVKFLRKLIGESLPPGKIHVSAFVLYVAHVPRFIAEGSRGFRAPPSSIPSNNFIT
jgi:hypothetical protein